MKTAEYWIRKLKLKKHPEGGYYREIYKAAQKVSTRKGPRSAGTAIYFLLKDPQVSVFHKIISDEIWHFYGGQELVISVLNSKTKKMKNLKLGGSHFHAVVPGGSWFGAYLKKRGSYALVGCTVAPGFDFHDFKIAKRESLLGQFPGYKQAIRKLTRA